MIWCLDKDLPQDQERQGMIGEILICRVAYMSGKEHHLDW